MLLQLTWRCCCYRLKSIIPNMRIPGGKIYGLWTLLFGKVFTSKFVGAGPLPYKKRIYWAVVPQRLRNTALGCENSELSIATRPFLEATLCSRAGGFRFTRHLWTPQGFSGRSVSIDGVWIGVRVRFLCYSLADVYKSHSEQFLNHLTPNGHYIGRTAQLTSRCCILFIYSTNIHTEYFEHAA